MKKSELMQSSYGERESDPIYQSPPPEFRRSYQLVRSVNPFTVKIQLAIAVISIGIYFLVISSDFSYLGPFVVMISLLIVGFLRKGPMLSLYYGGRIISEVGVKDTLGQFDSKEFPIRYKSKPVEVVSGGIRPIVTWGGEKVIEARWPWKDSERELLTIGDRKYEFIGELFVSPDLAEGDILILATRLNLDAEPVGIP